MKREIIRRRSGVCGKLLFCVSLLFCFSFLAYSQDVEENQSPISSVLIQLHRISIEQAKKSADPQTALEQEYNLIVNELEQTYLQREKEQEAKYQAKLTEQEEKSKKRVDEVEQKAQADIAIIQMKLEFLQGQQRSDFWHDAGTFGSGFSLGVGTSSLAALIYMITGD